MAEDFESRTEPATPHRREEARKQGQVAFSAELAASLVLLAGVSLLGLLGPRLGRDLLDAVRTELPAPAPRELGTSEAKELLAQQFTRWLGLVGAFFGIIVLAAVAANVVQVGFYLAPEKVTLHPERLSFAEGWQKLFSMAALVRGGLAVLKVTALAVLAWLLMRGRAGIVVGLARGSARTPRRRAGRC